MEILNTKILDGLSQVPPRLAFFLAIILMACTLAVTLGFWNEVDSRKRAVMIVLTVIAFVLFASACIWLALPTGTAEYTVEITDDSYFKWIVDNGYTVKDKLYENRDIYKIVGTVMEGV